VGELGLRVTAGDTDFPVGLLRRSALEHNERWMGAFLQRSGAILCPHGKTTMAPQLFHRQLAAGAWGITLATAQQARIAYTYGIKRILLANELVSASALRWIQGALDEDPDFDFTCLVDSTQGVALLANRAPGSRPLDVLVELGIPGGRCGARSLAAALDVARAVRASGRLRLRGVECYEGIIATSDPDGDRVRIQAWLEQLGELARRCQAEDLFETGEVLLTAGGSATFDLVAQVLSAIPLGRPSRVVLRSGCYFSHDAGHYRHLLGLLEQRASQALPPGESLRPALEIWGQVVSRPEPGLAFLGLGKRDVSHDLGLPLPAFWARPSSADRPSPVPASWRLTTLYDQHAKLELPADADLQPGDLVGCAISHPCTTFDKWPVLLEVDDNYRVLGAIRTFF
jgi:D-serine dehydratase